MKKSTALTLPKGEWLLPLLAQHMRGQLLQQGAKLEVDLSHGTCGGGRSKSRSKQTENM